MLSEALHGLRLSRRRLLASLAPPLRQPHVLILHSDDQRADTIGALGNPWIETPNLDRLVKRGTAFRNCYNQGGHQPAVCVASRAMLLSGKSLWRATAAAGLNGPLMPERFAEAGYETFFTGKWHLGAELLERSFQMGGGVHLGGMAPQVQPSFSLFRQRQSKPIPNRATPYFTDGFLDYLANRKKHQKPFFAYCAYTAPHDPRESAGEYLARYREREIPLPRPWSASPIYDQGETRIRDEMVVPAPRSRAQCQKELKDYYALITEMDAQIGRILAVLEAKNELENTIIIFCSDNGLAMGAHGLMGKQSMYEHSLRVPLVVAGPGIRREKQSAPMYLYELYSRLCRWAGLSVPGGVEKPGAPLYFGYRDFQRAVRIGTRKMAWSAKTLEQYDLGADPHEELNLVGTAKAWPEAEFRTAAREAQEWFADPVGLR
jgi:arylsulfatase A-like enzyme